MTLDELRQQYRDTAQAEIDTRYDGNEMIRKANILWAQMVRLRIQIAKLDTGVDDPALTALLAMAERTINA